MIDKKTFEKTEYILYNYKKIVSDIEMLREEIKDLEDEYNGCGAIGYDERTQATNKFNSSVEDEVMERDREIKRLKRELNNKKKIIRRVNSAVSNLKETQRKLIELRYFSNYTESWGNIGRILNFNPDYCRLEFRETIINIIGDTVFKNPYEQQMLKI